MADALTYGLPLIALIALAILIYIVVMQRNERRKKLPHQGVVKRDWVATGRIDFAMGSVGATKVKNQEQPSEFTLLVEEQRIMESIAGDENLEIQWRLATVSEAKAVVSQYHKYLSDHSLIKSITDNSASTPPLMPAQESPSDSVQ